ncbi:MAG: hypothetical protein IPL39_16125 [Opitutaceae bacterium]|nr:hypothetical protein [Opitutaceae bacterium]
MKFAILILLFGAVLAVTLKAWPKMRRTVKVIIGLGLAGVLAVVAFMFLAFSPGREESAKHLARVDWLPTEASDVTYLKRGGFGWLICYECSLPRVALDRLAEKEGWSLEPKSDVSTGLRRDLGLPSLKTTEYGEIDSVAKALFYEKRHSNNWRSHRHLRS